MTDGARREAARDWLSRAGRALASARRELASDAWETATNRAYYAAFYAAKGLLATRDLDVRKHAGAISLVGERFVRPGLLPTQAGRDLNDLLQARIKADYDLSATLTDEAVTSYVRQAEEFVAEAERLLREEGWLRD